MQVLCLLAVLVPLVTCLLVPPVEPIYPVRPIRICPIPLCVAPADDLSARSACQNQCNTDQDCGAGGLCCPLCGCNSCVGGTRPVTLPPPPPPTDPCKRKRCPAGQVCRLQTIFCIKAPCPGPFATCVPATKPQGVCPPPSGLVSTCDFVPGRDCLSDDDCLANQKCCSEGCGKRCKKPILP